MRRSLHHEDQTFEDAKAELCVQERVRKCLSSMSDQDRRLCEHILFLAQDPERVTNQAIAERAGVTEAAIRKRLSRLRERLEVAV